MNREYTFEVRVTTPQEDYGVVHESLQSILDEKLRGTTTARVLGGARTDLPNGKEEGPK